MGYRRNGFTAAFAALPILIWAGAAAAYPNYSTNGGATGACATCHGSFTAGNYQSASDGTAWGTSLMGGHESMLDNDCTTCHSSATTFTPVSLDSSAGGTGLPAISCMGCHGREQDNIALNPEVSAGRSGRGAGLRRHHFTEGVTVCADCHLDADPADGYTPVGEDVEPAYYFTPDTAHENKPTNACNDNGSESVFGSTGLDNDGDGVYDMADSDCAPAPVCGDGNVGPGETCDPPSSCPTSCDDGDACTTDTMTGSAATCNVVCTNTAITSCINGDGCCPAGCNAATDNDCATDGGAGTGGSAGADAGPGGSGGVAGTGGTDAGPGGTGGVAGTDAGPGGSGGVAGTGGTDAGPGGTGGSAGTDAGPGGTGGSAGTGGSGGAAPGGNGGGCSCTLPGGNQSAPWTLLVLGLGVAALLRKRG